MAGVGILLVAGYAVVRMGDGAASTDTTAAGGPSPSASASPGQPELNRWSFDRGRCYIWNQDDRISDADEVPCASPHLFEAVRKLDIASDYPTDSAYPTETRWREINDRYCEPVARDFLGYPFDPHGRFASGIIRPSRFGWESGDRALVCGLIAAGNAATPNRLVPFTGVVEGADQARVYPPGTCLELTTTETKGEIPCGAPHQAEVTGTATLPNTSDGQPPSEAAFEELARSRCQAVATRFLGRPFRDTETMQVSALHLAAESWRAGTRTITCMIIFVDGRGGFAAVTGALSHTGEGVMA
ncbi:septum formation family protein [Protofrankia coriariae]|uniref:septum formation family protein n=1 Tax=Protofrankia coriariae TaxID=1562887 RepID=UPI00069BE578|nr:septum formation family protein [Protofrankia coriariae]